MKTTARDLIFRGGRWLPLLLGLAAWEFVSMARPSLRFFFSSPSEVLAMAGHMLVADAKLGADLMAGRSPPTTNDGLLWNSAITAFEAVSGFLIGNVVGAMLGIGLSSAKSVARVVRPYLVALGAAPVFAIAPITILWFGVGVGAKVMLATLSTVFLAANQAFQGAQQVDPLLARRFEVFGASRFLIFKKLLLPTALVWIVSSLRLSVGAALLGAFVGEFIASEQGIGRVIIRASGLYDTPRVLVGVLAMIVMALLLDALVGCVDRRLFRWRNGGRA
jgi:NitT/TauT family transport system permease protein